MMPEKGLFVTEKVTLIRISCTSISVHMSAIRMTRSGTTKQKINVFPFYYKSKDKLYTSDEIVVIEN